MGYYEPLREQNKQRINLTNYAYQIVCDDLKAFLRIEADDSIKRKTPAGLADFINRVIHNYHKEAHVSIEMCCTKKESEIRGILAPILTAGQCDKAVDALVERYRSELIREAEKLPTEKEHELNIRLDKESMDVLTGEVQGETAHYFKVAKDGQHVFYTGKYLKALLEEYTRLPLGQREKVFFPERFDKIRGAIRSNTVRILKIMLYGLDKNTGRNRVIYMKPKDLICASDTGYHYLVGWIGNESTGPWTMRSLRVTSFKKIDALEKTEYINSDERKEIEANLRKNGPAFLSMENERIIVRFTKKGLHMYQNQLAHLRPPSVPLDKDNEYLRCFDCTAFHARAYFFKFGKDAVIVEPEYLTQEFYSDYKNAVSAYEVFNA